LALDIFRVDFRRLLSLPLPLETCRPLIYHACLRCVLISEIYWDRIFCYLLGISKKCKHFRHKDFTSSKLVCTNCFKIVCIIVANAFLNKFVTTLRINFYLKKKKKSFLNVPSDKWFLNGTYLLFRHFIIEANKSLAI